MTAITRAALLLCAAAAPAAGTCLAPSHVATCAAAAHSQTHTGDGACAGKEVTAAPCAQGLDGWQVERVLEKHNAHRQDHGACPLGYSKALEEAVLNSAGFQNSCKTGERMEHAETERWVYGENTLRSRSEEGRADTFDPGYAVWRWYCQEEGCADWEALSGGGDTAQLTQLLNKGATEVGCGVCHASTNGYSATIIFACAYDAAAASLQASVGRFGDAAACDTAPATSAAPAPQVTAPTDAPADATDAPVPQPMQGEADHEEGGASGGLVAATVLFVLAAVALWTFICVTTGYCALMAEKAAFAAAAAKARVLSLRSEEAAGPSYGVVDTLDDDAGMSYAKLEEIPGSETRGRLGSSASRLDTTRLRGESFGPDKSEALLSAAYLTDGDVEKGKNVPDNASAPDGEAAPAASPPTAAFQFPDVRSPPSPKPAGGPGEAESLTNPILPPRDGAKRPSMGKCG